MLNLEVRCKLAAPVAATTRHAQGNEKRREVVEPATRAGRRSEARRLGKNHLQVQEKDYWKQPEKDGKDNLDNDIIAPYLQALSLSCPLGDNVSANDI